MKFMSIGSFHTDKLDKIAERLEQDDPHSNADDQFAKQLIKSLYNKLSDPSADQSVAWINEFARFCEIADDPQKKVVLAEIFANDFDISLFDVTSHAGFAVIQTCGGQYFAEKLKIIADKTGLASARFLSAWGYLNANMPEAAADACDQIDQPQSQVLTLHGQALLESGRPEEAIAILKGACTINPSDPLPLFQLAKAHYVLDQWDPAWTALEDCAKFDYYNAEIGFLMAEIALNKKTCAPWLERASDILFHHLNYLSQSTSESTADDLSQTTIQALVLIHFKLMHLAASMDRRDLFKRAILPIRLRRPDIYLQPNHKFPELLRSLRTLGWDHETQELLTIGTIPISVSLP